jgi:hypothetical protein
MRASSPEGVAAVVSGDSSDDILTMRSISHGGELVAEHWNGTDWTYVPLYTPATTTPAPTTVEAISEDDVWTVE